MEIFDKVVQYLINDPMLPYSIACIFFLLLIKKCDSNKPLWSFLGTGMRRVGRKPEGEGTRPQAGQGEGRPPTDRRPVDRRPPRRFERPAGEAGEKPEGGEFSVEKWVNISNNIIL